MTIAITIAIGSIAGILVLYLRHVPQVLSLTSEELAGVLQRELPLLTQAWEKIVRCAQSLWRHYLRIRILSFLVKKVHQLRIISMRAEQMLFRVASRLRARSQPVAQVPPSDYWKDIHGWRKTVHWHKKGTKAE
ncbi:MAG: hypothetical protein AAB710_02505 [Patescibacteria group bacterium]